MRSLLTLGAFLLAPASALAVCTGGHASVKEEFGYTPQVVIAEAVSEYKVLDPEDPDGFMATIYVIKVHRTFKGGAVQTVHLWSDNTSSRYLMNLGQSHLLFLQTGEDGFFLADSCGNSGLLNEGSQAYRTVLLLSANGSNNSFKVTPDGAPQLNR
jgi:hypothetical protein